MKVQYIWTFFRMKVQYIWTFLGKKFTLRFFFELCCKSNCTFFFCKYL